MERLVTISGGKGAALARKGDYRAAELIYREQAELLLSTDVTPLRGEPVPLAQVAHESLRWRAKSCIEEPEIVTRSRSPKSSKMQARVCRWRLKAAVPLK